MKFNSKEEKVGYDLAKGACRYIGGVMLTAFLFCLCVWAAMNALGVGTDSSDFDGWNRSGLKIHTDALTGIEYFSDGKGGLIRRESK